MTARTPWRWWFLWLWGAEAAGLAALWFVLAFQWWVVAFAGTFLTTEIAGIHWESIGLMPLTEAIRRYVPRWFAFPALFLAIGGGITRAGQMAHKWSVALLFAFMGWVQAHFDVTFDEPPF